MRPKSAEPGSPLLRRALSPDRLHPRSLEGKSRRDSPPLSISPLVTPSASPPTGVKAIASQCVTPKVTISSQPPAVVRECNTVDISKSSGNTQHWTFPPKPPQFPGPYQLTIRSSSADGTIEKVQPQTLVTVTAKTLPTAEPSPLSKLSHISVPSTTESQCLIASSTPSTAPIPEKEIRKLSSDVNKTDSDANKSDGNATYLQSDSNTKFLHKATEKPKSTFSSSLNMLVLPDSAIKQQTTNRKQLDEPQIDKGSASPAVATSASKQIECKQVLLAQKCSETKSHPEVRNSGAKRGDTKSCDSSKHRMETKHNVSSNKTNQGKVHDSKQKLELKLCSESTCADISVEKPKCVKGRTTDGDGKQEQKSDKSLSSENATTAKEKSCTPFVDDLSLKPDVATTAKGSKNSQKRENIQDKRERFRMSQN